MKSIMQQQRCTNKINGAFSIMGNLGALFTEHNSEVLLILRLFAVYWRYMYV